MKKRALVFSLLSLCLVSFFALVSLAYGENWFGLNPGPGSDRTATVSGSEESSPGAAADKAADSGGGATSGEDTPERLPDGAEERDTTPAKSGDRDLENQPVAGTSPEKTAPEKKNDSPGKDKQSSGTQPVSRGGQAKTTPSSSAGENFSAGVDYKNFRPVAVESPGGGRIKEYKHPDPKDLVTVPGTKYKLHRLAAEAYLAMVAHARADGIEAPLLRLNDGYRTRERQEELFKAAVARYGSEEEARLWVAKFSNHETGRAIDLYLGGSNDRAHALDGSLRQLPAYKWLEKNARRYGFYPYDNPWPGEPWHWEYNPPAS